MADITTLGAPIKEAYESQANTNAFTDAEKQKLADMPAAADVATLSDIPNAAEIKTLYESNANTNAFTDAEKQKLEDTEIFTEDDIGAISGLSVNNKIELYALGAGGLGDLVSVVGQSSNTFRVTSSSFAGWGFPIGPQQNFNTAKLDINTWDATSLPTKARAVIKANDENGSIIADTGIFALSGILDDSIHSIVSQFPGVIPNSSLTNLWFEIYTDGYFSFRTSATVPYATPPVKYTGSKTQIDAATPTVASLASGAQTNAYVLLYMGPLEDSQEQLTAGPMNSLASTFSGWEFPLGQKRKFNSITLDLQWWDLSVPPPSNLRVMIRDVGSTLPALAPNMGNILSDKTVSYVDGDWQLGVTKRVKVFFDEDIDSPNYLAVGFYADSRIGWRGLFSVALNDDYGRRRYVTTSSISSIASTQASTQDNVWNITQYYNHAMERFEGEDDYTSKLQTVALAPYNSVKSQLPSTLYALEGRELNVYYRNVLRLPLAYENYRFNVDVQSDKGRQDQDWWRITPVSADAGTYNWTLETYLADKLVNSATCSLVVKALTAGNGVTRKLNLISDSTGANGLYLAELVRLFNGDVMTLSLQGSISMNANDSTSTSRAVKHDAVSGRTIAYFYANTGATINATSSGIASAYRGGTKLTADYASTGVSTFNVTGTAGLTVGATIYPSFGTANAEALTVQSFTSTSITTTAPSTKTHANGDALYWDSGAFSYANYLTNQGITMAANDWVMVHLGINDVFSYTDDTALRTGIGTMSSQLQAMITNIKAAVSGIRIGLLLTIPPSISQDAFGDDYGENQTQRRYRRNRDFWVENMLRVFSNQTNVHLLPFHANLDTANNMPAASTAYNARNSNTYLKQNNGVHPDSPGYWQMADSLRCILKGFET